MFPEAAANTTPANYPQQSSSILPSDKVDNSISARAVLLLLLLALVQAALLSLACIYLLIYYCKLIFSSVACLKIFTGGRKLYDTVIVSSSFLCFPPVGDNTVSLLLFGTSFVEFNTQLLHILEFSLLLLLFFVLPLLIFSLLCVV
jgi:hypothetical protein